MKLKCDVCKRENGSCNRYRCALGEITICPSCLTFGSGKVAEAARRLHKAGDLIQDEEKKAVRKKGGRK